MDANGLKFWLLADAGHWRLEAAAGRLSYHDRRRALRLARQRRDAPVAERREEAEALLQQVPALYDSEGNHAWYDAGEHRILAQRPGVAAPVTLLDLPAGSKLTDMVLDSEGVLYLALDGGVILHDRRRRWDDIRLSLEDFEAWRLAASPTAGCWVLDRRGRLAQVLGRPRASLSDETRGRPRPCPPDPEAPRLQLRSLEWPEGERPVALACAGDGRLAVLSWRDQETARLWLFSLRGEARPPLVLHAARWPFTLAWLGAEQVAVLLTGEPHEARVYAVAGEGMERWPLGDLYPLKADYLPAPFLHGPGAARYRAGRAASHALRRLSYPFYQRKGTVSARRPVDGLEYGRVWHRAYLEAVIPPGCGLRLWLAASDSEQDAEAIEASQWFEHRFGAGFSTTPEEGVAVGAWEPRASELPHHPGLLPCVRQRGRAGLFSVLIQRSGRKVRSLRGRYLHVRLEFSGTGNATPEVFALRIYGGRFSYVENYLPRLYREQLVAPEADQQGAATGADFLERYLAIAEGVMTQIEDSIARADLLSRPATVPEEGLEWLAGWLGLALEPTWNEAQRRRFLAHAMTLYRWHGTQRGLALAIDLATEGAVADGRVVIVEAYRLRRVVATLLGGRYGGEDPLLPAGSDLGHSIIGDNLFLGEAEVEEFLALFAASLGLDPREQAAVAALFDRLAHRLTLLVREDATAALAAAVQRMAERQVPAHVQWQIISAPAPLLVGLSALVGVDTYLVEREAPGSVTVGRGRLGGGDRVRAGRGLAPEGGTAAGPGPPVARADDVAVAWGEDVVLDASASTAAPGHRLTEYRWRITD